MKRTIERSDGTKEVWEGTVEEFRALEGVGLSEAALRKIIQEEVAKIPISNPFYIQNVPYTYPKWPDDYKNPITNPYITWTVCSEGTGNGVK